MSASIRVLFILVIVTSLQSCFGYYIRSSEESLVTNSDQNKEWAAEISPLKIEPNKSQKDQDHQISRILQALFSDLKNLSQMPISKPLKRFRRKIADHMSSEDLIKMYYDKHNIQISNDDDDYGDLEMFRQAQMDSDYAYDNLYDDERDVALTAKSNRNSGFGSFQDLILLAKRNQLEQEKEETKLQMPHNDHFF